MNMNTIRLYNGVEMPQIGYGVYQVTIIPKSTHKERMAQNIDIFDFSLSDGDMAQIAKMNQHDAGTRDFGDPQFVKYLIETYG